MAKAGVKDWQAVQYVGDIGACSVMAGMRRSQMGLLVSGERRDERIRFGESGSSRAGKAAGADGASAKDRFSMVCSSAGRARLLRAACNASGGGQGVELSKRGGHVCTFGVGSNFKKLALFGRS